ncbi:MAG: PorV/PorQ family protein [Bacteroidales bacterium]|nr:PorV/PorQ family protein [Bacteroidales bacterium]
MKKIYRKYLAALIAVLMISPVVLYAGNKDRVGEAGASQLLINPWGASSGWGNCNTAAVRGTEGFFMNIAGTAFTKGTDVAFTYMRYLTDINIYSIGLTQQVGEVNAIGIYMMNMSWGDVPITTESIPEGGMGNYSPNCLNLGVSFARMFSNSIYGGILVKIISENLANIKATGVAFDVGIQYVTGKTDNLKFGITLKNWGPTMSFNGDGLSIRTVLDGKGENQFTLQTRETPFEMPSQLLIGLAYDFNFENDYRLTFSGTFISNAFSKDQIAIGAEVSLKDYLILRGGYTYEEGIFNMATRTTIFTGPSCGATVKIPVNKTTRNGFEIDYSYRFSNPCAGIHTVGVKLDF